MDYWLREKNYGPMAQRKNFGLPTYDKTFYPLQHGFLPCGMAG